MTHENLLNDVRDACKLAVGDRAAVFERLKRNTPEEHIYHLLYENCLKAQKTLTRLDAFLAEKTTIDADYKDVQWYKHGDDLHKYYVSEALMHEHNERISRLLQTATTKGNDDDL